MEQEKTIIISEEVLASIRDGDLELAGELMKAISNASEGLGFVDDGVSYSRLIERNIFLPIHAVDVYENKRYEVKSVILNPERVWKGEGWTRGVFDIEEGRMVFRKYWPPILDVLRESRLL